MNSMKKTMLANVAKMPDDWNGGEIRQYISDFVKDQANYMPIAGPRMKSYRNEVLVRNL